ncbi:MAG: hypothetical protein V2J89_10705 [Halieaceae bacterium]|nr:hypothetical protein [Halieaceae bacterium]
MAELFASGRIIDLILLGILIELAILPAVLRRTGSPVLYRELLPNIAAGACLMLAVRLGLTDQPWQAVALALLLALLAHSVDLVSRLTRRT